MEYIVLLMEKDGKPWFYMRAGSTKTIFVGVLKSAKKFKTPQEFDKFLNENPSYQSDKYRFWVMKEDEIIQSYRMHNA